MRRISLAIALGCALAASGCSGGAKSSTDAGGNPGVGEGTFKVTVQNTPPLDMKGGKVTSVPGGIDCGAGVAAADQKCEASFPLGQTVVLTATATGAASPDKDVNGAVLPYRFYGWAGDCSGEAATCTLKGAADKYVLATFAGKRTGHPNWSVGTVHAPEYNKYLAQTAGALDCTSCHGAALQGLGLAVSCGGCHAAPVLPKATIAFSPAPPTSGVIGQALSFSALATDPGGRNVTCTWSIAAKPVTSAISLATSGTCSGAAGTASFVPDLAGVYVVRVAPSNQASTAALQATIVVAETEFGGGEVSGTSAAPSDDLTAIAARLDAVLTIGKNTITADALATRLMNPKNVPQIPINIVDVRDPEDFAKGHIPGAINVPLAQLPSVLLVNPAQLPATELAIASYNGGDGNMATLLINAVRYNGTSIPNFALGIMGGMTTWSFDRELSPTRFDDDNGVRRVENGALETAANAGTDQGAYPAFTPFTSNADDVTKKLLVRAAAYLKSLEQEAAAAGVPHREAFWTTFVEYNQLKAAGEAPQVLSVRSAAHYTGLGHVPGAMNIVWGAAGKLTNTKIIDPTKKVFVYCYTGHTGGQATMALGIMGYKARNLLYGINGWTSNATVAAVPLQKFDATRAFDFPQHDWPGVPGTLVGYVPPRATCKECHESQTAQWYDLIVNPVATGPAQPASEGEG